MRFKRKPKQIAFPKDRPGLRCHIDSLRSATFIVSRYHDAFHSDVSINLFPKNRQKQSVKQWFSELP